jgi:hypothetical protein
MTCVGVRSGHKALIMATPLSFCRCCVYCQEGGFGSIDVLS